MTGTGERAVAEAEKWIGTPYRHQAAEIGVGCDCLGLIRGVWGALYGTVPGIEPPYAAAWAAQGEAKGRKASLLQGVFHALSCFLRMYIFRAGFLDGKQGFLLAALSSHSTFVKYADLWVRQQR